MEELRDYMDLSPEVASALAEGRPIVAMESLIIAGPNFVERSITRAAKYKQMLAAKGVTPATIAILGGRIKIGLSDEEVSYLAHNGARKCSRRDVGALISMGLDGATTVTGTMMLASRAGIEVFATGGIGGVHRGAQQTFDISADLQELSHTRMAIVASGCKSILDISLTLEYLETMGIPVLGYKTDEFPSFFCRESGHGVDYRIDDPAQIAQMLQVRKALGIEGGLLVCNPIREEDALDYKEIDGYINAACEQAAREGVTGKKLTPWLLEAIVKASGGRTQKANMALIEHNIDVAADIAIACAAAK